MTQQTGPIPEADLHAYVDGRLPEARRAELEAFLAANPQDAGRVRAYRKQNEALRALFDPVLDENVPSRMKHPPRQIGLLLVRYAMIVLWITVGGVLGWMARGPDDRRVDEPLALARQAALAHLVYTPEVRHPVEVGGDQEEHLVNWLSKRLGASLKAPALSEIGYDLVGGRLLPGNQGPVAQFMYQDKKGQRLTLYVRSGSGTTRETAFRFARERGVSVFYWLDGPLGYALSGEVERAELVRIAKTIYHQINP